MEIQHFEITHNNGTKTFVETTKINESLSFSKTYNIDEIGYGIKNLMLHIVEKDKNVSLNEEQTDILLKFIK